MFTFITEGTFRPLTADGVTATSKRKDRLGLADEINTTIQSSPFGSAWSTSAGRTFWPVRSVNGKGTRIMSPLDIALLQIGHTVQVGFGGEKIEALGVSIDVRDVVDFFVVHGGKLD